jgi:nitroreductase
MTRRSIRKFTDEKVDRQALQTILEAGRMAPTAGNLQPCYFVVVEDPALRMALKEAALDQEQVVQAPTVIVVCADPERSSYYGDVGRNYLCLLDCANTVENMLLAAHALGYGTCWMGGFKEKKVKQLLGLPEGFRVVALVPVGRPAETPEVPPRRPLEEMVRWEKWS